MAKEQNLIKYGVDKPPLSREQAKKLGRKGGKKSAVVRAAKKTSRQIVEMLDCLPVTGNNKENLRAFGIPDGDLTQLTLRLVALHKKALSGDSNANKLLLEIRGEAPTQTLNIEVGDETRAAYDRAAGILKGKGG
jgi:hypothetical protein